MLPNAFTKFGTMTYSFIQIITILCIVLTSTDASGTIVIRISSPITVLVEPTVCANFDCPAPDELAMQWEIQAGSMVHLDSGHYRGESRERIDMHFKILDPTTKETIAVEHFRPFADNNWNQADPLVMTTSQGFNVSVAFVNRCDNYYYGKRCGRYCVPSSSHHWECSDEGDRQCAAGWTGVDCSKPICLGGCNGHGLCISPNKCSCFDNFFGTQCEQCVPRAGCLHGGCLNGDPNTCQCKDGFIGDKCDIDINICSTQKPCHNRGQCSVDTTSGNGFRCDCPTAFSGVRCQIPLAIESPLPRKYSLSKDTSVAMAAPLVEEAPQGEEIPLSTETPSTEETSSTRLKFVSIQIACRNDGYVLEDDMIRCKCKKGFTGKFCEFRVRKDCSTLECYNNSECLMVGDVPMCLDKPSKNKETDADIPKKSTERQEMNESSENKSSIAESVIYIVVISMLLFVCLYSVYYQFIIKRCFVDTPIDAPLPSLPMVETTSPVCKEKTIPHYSTVCISDAENDQTMKLSDCEPDYCLHCHSPPPPYSSPAMPRPYKTKPVDEDSLSREV